MHPRGVRERIVVSNKVLLHALAIRATDLSATAVRRKHQPVWIDILCNSGTKHFRWFLNTWHVVFGHPFVKLIEIRNLKVSAALSCAVPHESLDHGPRYRHYEVPMWLLR